MASRVETDLLSSSTPNQARSVLVVDDDELFADATAELLGARGYAVETAGSLRDAAAIDFRRYAWALVDDHLPDGSGMDLIPEMVRHGTKALLVSAMHRAEASKNATKLGFWDYLPKPLDIASLLSIFSIGGAPRAPAPEALLPSLRARADLLTALGRSRCPILITGETGTGKGHLARYLHERSGLRGRFVALNCAAVPAELFESELFGVERGAFTGSTSRPGLVEAAEDGTLFLDEIGELPLQLQAKVLTFLDTGVVRRVGSPTERRSSVRLVAATNRDLESECAARTFRVDLFHRLDVARVELPPLRERAADIDAICGRELARLSARDGRPYVLASGEGEILRGLAWPGNIRELQNAFERAVLMSPSDVLSPSMCLRSAGARVGLSQGTSPERGADLSLATAERAHILAVLERTRGNRTQAAELLGIGLSTLRRKLTSWEETK